MIVECCCCCCSYPGDLTSPRFGKRKIIFKFVPLKGDMIIFRRVYVLLKDYHCCCKMHVFISMYYTYVGSLWL